MHCNRCDASNFDLHTHVFNIENIPIFPDTRNIIIMRLCHFIQEFLLIQRMFKIPLLTQFVYPKCICVCRIFESNRIESNDSSLNLIQVRLTKVLFAMSQREMRDKCDKRHIAKACILCMRVSKIE